MEGISCAVLQAVNEALSVAQVKPFWNTSSCALLQPVLDGSEAAWCPVAGSVQARGLICLGSSHSPFTPCRHSQSSHGADRNSRV